jgi:hypothetical protein
MQQPRKWPVLNRNQYAWSQDQDSSRDLGLLAQAIPRWGNYQYKVRNWVWGNLEQGKPETYAPIVAWISVRLFLVLPLTLGWQTCSIDFSSAFVQANLTDPVWIHMPQGFKFDQASDQRTCLRLVKSLYGLSVAPCLWYKHICEALLLQGLKQSATDSCLFTSILSWLFSMLLILGLPTLTRKILTNCSKILLSWVSCSLVKANSLIFLASSLSRMKSPTLLH